MVTTALTKGRGKMICCLVASSVKLHSQKKTPMSARLFTELYSECIFNSNTYVILLKQRISNAWKTPNAY